jgi:hypothetical protein
MHTLLRRVWTLQRILAGQICRRYDLELLAGLLRWVVNIIHQCMYLTAELARKNLKRNPISSTPDHATQEAGIASRCESNANLLGELAT